MSRTGYRSTAAFSATADAYAATMAPSLRPVAAEVIRLADLRPGETVLDLGTGTGTAALMAAGDGRRVIGLDAAAGMLELARAVRFADRSVEWVEADFTAVPLADASVDVLVSVHALLFATDRVRALREWRRVTRSGGRLSLSVPGPGEVMPGAAFGAVFDRYGLAWRADEYPTEDEFSAWAREAGWEGVETSADPEAVIHLADEVAFRTWLRVGRTASDWPPDRLDRFARDLMDVCPRRPDGGFAVPFGALYLTASRP